MGCGASTAPREIVITETKASPRDSSPRDSSPPDAFAAFVNGVEGEALAQAPVEEAERIEKEKDKLPTKQNDEVPSRRELDLTTSPSSTETDLPDNNPELKSNTNSYDSDTDSAFSDLNAAFDAEVEDEDDPSQKDGASPDYEELRQKKAFNEERRRSKTEFELSMAQIQADMEAGQASRLYVRRKSTHDDKEMKAFRGDSLQLGTDWRREDRMEQIKVEAKSRLRERRLSCGENTAHDVGFKLYLQQRRNEMMIKRAQLEEGRKTPTLALSMQKSSLAARRANRARTMPMQMPPRAPPSPI